jgi:hypothetical protein
MDNGRNETVGKIIYDILDNEPENAKLDPIEAEREAHKDYAQQLHDAVVDGKKAFPGDFFLEVITIKVPLLKRAISNKIIIRRTAPTPTYDSTAYHYHKSDDHLEFLWVVPSKDACEYLYLNAIKVAPEERELRDFVIDYFDGTLLRRCKKLNNEEIDSNRLVKE